MLKKRSLCLSPAASRRDLLRVDRRWAWHYRTLVALRDHLVAEARAATVDGTDRFDRDFIRALLAREPDPLAEINAAIERILRGSYGVCVATGWPVPAARLRAAPWVRLGDAGRQEEITPPGIGAAPTRPWRFSAGAEAELAAAFRTYARLTRRRCASETGNNGKT